MLKVKGKAQEIYDGIRELPIVSPHGHCEPIWFAENAVFPNPAELLVVPDHYVFRMLFSQGIPLEKLGVGVPEDQRNPREIFSLLAQNWHLFLGTPSQLWMEYVLEQTFQIDVPLNSETSDRLYDIISERLSDEDFRPRALFDAFNIEVLATTDPATNNLSHHQKIANSGWAGRVIPTFRPDDILDPNSPHFETELQKLQKETDTDTGNFSGFLDALRLRRAFFKDMGATATDHATETVQTHWLDNPEALFARITSGKATVAERDMFYGHMLVEMAQMSTEDGLVMQIHGGSRRNTNQRVFEDYGRDKGADIPTSTNWVSGLEPLLNRVGNSEAFHCIVFTLDESTYARELAPMAGHWPCLKIGPPWWFHDSPNGIARYFDNVVETAGYQNLAGFNDDTRAFLSIPARHDLWRRCVALHLAQQIDRGYFGISDAEWLAKDLAVDAAKRAYNL